jgi:hypothetical protein
LLALAFIILTAGAVSAADGKFGEINLKLGYDFEGSASGHSVFDADAGLFSGGTSTGVEEMDMTEIQPASSGVSVGLEYLYPIPLPETSLFFPGFLKVGAGIQYMFPRTYWGGWEGGAKSTDTKFSLLPIYGIIQINPLKNLKEFFLRGSIGYAAFTSFEPNSEPQGMERGDRKGGLHWGISVGFEAGWGLFVEYDYSQSFVSSDTKVDPAIASYFNGPTTMTTDFVYGKSGVTIGYKIKL